MKSQNTGEFGARAGRDRFSAEKPVWLAIRKPASGKAGATTGATRGRDAQASIIDGNPGRIFDSRPRRRPAIGLEQPEHAPGRSLGRDRQGMDCLRAAGTGASRNAASRQCTAHAGRGQHRRKGVALRRHAQWRRRSARRHARPAKINGGQRPSSCRRFRARAGCPSPGHTGRHRGARCRRRHQRPYRPDRKAAAVFGDEHARTPAAEAGASAPRQPGASAGGQLRVAAHPDPALRTPTGQEPVTARHDRCEGSAGRLPRRRSRQGRRRRAYRDR